MKYWWRIRRALLIPIVKSPLSAILGVVCFAVLILGVSITYLNVAGWVLAILSFLGGITYFSDYGIRRFVRRHAPIFEKNIRPEDFTNAPQALTPEYRFAAPSDSSDLQLYPYVDLSHYTAFIRAENDLNRQERLALYKKWYQLCPTGFLHLEKLIGSEWRPIAVSIILPLSLAGFAAITRGDKDHQTPIIDLGRNDIQEKLTRRHGLLLIDTWIVDREFGGRGHGKKPGQGGFANALVLRHIGQFWNSSNRFPEVTFLVETDNKHLVPILSSFAFRPGGHSKIGEVLYEVNKSMMIGLAYEEFKRLVLAIRALESMPIEKGTVAPPSDWTNRFKPDA